MTGIDLGFTVSSLVSGGAVGVFGLAVVQLIRSRGEIDIKRLDINRDIRKNTEELATKLLDIAENRVAQFQKENSRLVRNINQMHQKIYEADRAIDLLKKMLSPNARVRAVADRQARTFLADLEKEEDDGG